MTANRFPTDNIVGDNGHASAFPFDDKDYNTISSSSNNNNSNDSDSDVDHGVTRRCQQIVAYYEEEAHKPVYEMARWLVEQLNPQLQEMAAQCSYSYWYLSTRQQQQQPKQPLPSESARFATALREAIRHMDCADDPAEILRIFKATLEFHTSNGTWLYRTCMDTAKDTPVRGRERRDRIHDEMTNFQTNVVRGHDKEDRAIFFAFPRKKAGTAEGEHAFVDSLVYTIERTLACSEFRSVGRQDQLFVVLDTRAGSCPPIKTLQNAVGILQSYYPGRLKGCVIVNAPYVLRTVWKMIRPFLHPVTAQKYIFGPSPHNKTNNVSVIAELIDESQAMPVLIPEKGQLTAEVEVDRFLFEIPFHQLYDEFAAGSGDSKPGMLKERQISPSTESNSTTSLSSTDSFPVRRHSMEHPSTKPSRTSLRRFSLNSWRNRDAAAKSKSRSSKQQPPFTKSNSRNVSVSVRTLAIGKLSVTSLPDRPTIPLPEPSDESGGYRHRDHW